LLPVMTATFAMGSSLESGDNAKHNRNISERRGQCGGCKY
jgi:hypothetical protein